MANDGNGSDRLDRIEAALQRITGVLVQVVQQQERLLLSMTQLGDKLDGLIGVVEAAHRNFNERLKRLEQS